MLNLLLFFSYLLHLVSGQSCDSTKILNVTALDSNWICTASFSMPALECQNAFDGKEYTYWHPGHNGTGSVLTLQLRDDVVLTGLKIYQYTWITGYADLISVNFGGRSFKIRANVKREFVWNGKIQNRQIRGKFLRIKILSISGGSMGPFKEVQLIGCSLRGEIEEDYNSVGAYMKDALTRKCL
ncbi:uncharacterized protein LOC111711899 isoform X2 [Eurytemora carolleeae]|uniref:uncharacterized protein LOC111711899 isoform X2 n=1 Tax=Eurytemora carolleeae TaxID=1294199 RepID=UPI000C76A38B|nr:uncharacterized protein LOC111711899 isoform X2 [Eurytemora carolleeae]|eukprot:XP_023342144.1 uncharacterized protein LOC111711899 isoform X2 [Eurytemora affinis]